jgi:hypothetical protein
MIIATIDWMQCLTSSGSSMIGGCSKVIVSTRVCDPGNRGKVAWEAWKVVEAEEDAAAVVGAVDAVDAVAAAVEARCPAEATDGIAGFVGTGADEL